MCLHHTFLLRPYLVNECIYRQYRSVLKFGRGRGSAIAPQHGPPLRLSQINRGGRGAVGATDLEAAARRKRHRTLDVASVGRSLPKRVNTKTKGPTHERARTQSGSDQGGQKTAAPARGGEKEVPFPNRIKHETPADSEVGNFNFFPKNKKYRDRRSGGQSHVE